MKKTIFILTLFLLSSIPSMGIYYYPMKLTNHKIIDQGEILKIGNQYYFLNYGFLGEPSILYEINLQTFDRTHGLILESDNLLFAKSDKNNLYLLLISNDSLYLKIFNNGEIKYQIFISDKLNFYNKKVELNVDSNLILLQIDKSLYLLDIFKDFPKKITLISENVLNANFIKITNKFLIAYVEESFTYNLLKFVDINGKIIHSQLLPIYNDVKILNSFNYIIILLSTPTKNKTLVYLLNKFDYTIDHTYWFNASSDFVITKDIFLYVFQQNNNIFELIKINLETMEKDLTMIRKQIIDELSNNLIEPIFFDINNDLIHLIFKNAITIFDVDFKLKAFLNFPVSQFADNNIINVIINENKLILSTKVNSILFDYEKNDLWFIKYFYSKYGTLVIITISIVLIIVLLNKIRINRNLFKIISNLPTTGFIFIVNKNGKLIFANNLGSKIVNLSSNIPLKKNFKDYFKNDGIKEIYVFYEKHKTSNNSIKDKITMEIEGNLTEWLCYVLPIRNFRGKIKGFIVSGADITEQLEKKRLANWAQLAHDMQTNLSTIKLNAEQISSDNIENVLSRKKKILHQVNILMNRIRDILTVGRTDELELQTVYSQDLCMQAISEFDEELFPNVKFQLNVQNFELVCDKNKLIRAIRNAIENGIRALPDKKGYIIITAEQDSKFSYFSIKDTGIGMDDETKGKFLKPYFTTSSKYGGTGIGTIIMQKVVEMHNGYLQVDSTPNQGTTITFALPITKLNKAIS